MIKKIFTNLHTHKKVYGLLVLSLVVAPTILNQIYTTYAMVSKDGGGYDYIERRAANTLPSESLPATTSPSTQVNVSTRYVTNGSSAAGYRTQTIQVVKTLYYAWNRGLGTLYPSSDSGISGWVAGLADPNITIGYDFGVFDSSGTQRIPEGSTIAQGTQVVMKFSNYVSDNIFWFGTGYSMDSPYGEWRSNANATPRVSNKVVCDEKDLTQKYQLSLGSESYTFDVYVPFVVNPPQRNLGNLNGFSCGSLTTNGDGSMSAVCTATGNGTTTPTFSYDSTYGKFYYRYYDYRDMTNIGWGGPGCYGNNIAMSDTSTVSPYVVNIPNQSYSYPIIIGAVGNAPPTPPTMVCPGSVQVGQDITATLTSTDPDGDQIRYATGWFSNTSPDSGWTSLVNSGTAGNLTKTGGYATANSYTVYGWAQDTNGGTSGSSSCTVTVTDVPLPPALPPDAILDAQVNGGSWISNPDTLTVSPGDSVVLGWRGTDITNCSATAGADFYASGPSGNDGVTNPAANNSAPYTINCTGPGGSDTDTLTITTRGKADLTTPTVFTPTFGAFDATTGTFGNITLTFRTENGGNSPTNTTADYHFEFDTDGDGTIEAGEFDVTRTDALPTLAVTDGTNEQETVAGPIPIGNHAIRISVDLPGDDIDESNEGNNVYNGTVTVTAVDPGLSITADRTQVRNSETTIIRWTVATPYSGLTCRISGPGVNDPASLPSGNRSTLPITAKSEFTLTCTDSTLGTVWKDSVFIETTGTIEEI
jgi:hypothetical protein